MPAESLIPADPAARKRALRGVLVTGSLDLLGIFFFWETLTDLLTLHTAAPQLAADAIRNRVFLLAAGDVVVAMSVAAMLTAASYRTLQSNQFPPPGMKLLRATKLRTGLQAKRIAVLCFLSAVCIALLGMGTAASLAWSVWDIPDSPREDAVPA
jgi:hypothetical protein